MQVMHDKYKNMYRILANLVLLVQHREQRQGFRIFDRVDQVSEHPDLLIWRAILIFFLKIILRIITGNNDFRVPCELE